jgi:hypothetical protein
MGAWASATVARDELRAFLNDGTRDRPIKGKKLIGTVDGVNTEFFTYEERLVDDASLVVTVDIAVVSASITDATRGVIQLAAPPAQQTTVRGQYYFQYFLDSELDEALRNAAGEIIESDDITQVGFGFKNAALNYAGYFCFTKQAIRWAQRMSEKYILEDSPAEDGASQRPNLFNQIAQSYLKNAGDFRDSYYKRHGRRFAPAWAMFKPTIPPVGPKA